MSDFSDDSSGSEGEIFEGSQSEGFLEVEIKGEEYFEDQSTEILPYMFEPRQQGLLSKPEELSVESCEEHASEAENVDKW